MSVNVPNDFLTTVAINTFRSQYYFDKKQTTSAALEIHKKYKDDENYADYVTNSLPVMLASHKVISAIQLYDKGLKDFAESILLTTRPNMIPDFWILYPKLKNVLGLEHTGSGRSVRNFVWKFLNRIGESDRGLRKIAFWFSKNRSAWNKVCYQTHTKFRGDIERLASGILFGREFNPSKIKDQSTRDYFYDLAEITSRAKDMTLSLADIKASNLPFRTIEGLASKIIDTKSIKFYDATFNKMTFFETLRRTGAMLRNGFLSEYHDRYVEKMKRGARVFDPVDIGSVILQHPELRDDLLDAFVACIDSIGKINFPEKSVVLCDASRSMKLKLRFPRPRVIWELVALLASQQGVPTFLVRDTAEQMPLISQGGREVARAFGQTDAFNPTCLSRGLTEAGKLKSEHVFIISDFQTNIPYRGHEKLVAQGISAKVISLNPTINPREPEAATRLNVPNETFLPIRGIRYLKKVMEVIK